MHTHSSSNKGGGGKKNKGNNNQQEPEMSFKYYYTILLNFCRGASNNGNAQWRFLKSIIPWIWIFSRKSPFLLLLKLKCLAISKTRNNSKMGKNQFISFLFLYFPPSMSRGGGNLLLLPVSISISHCLSLTLPEPEQKIKKKKEKTYRSGEMSCSPSWNAFLRLAI